MTAKDLNEHLTKLRAELDEGPELDEDSREKIAALVQDIQRVLDRQAREDDEDPNDDDTLGERLQDAVLHFEAAHPQISQFIGRLADGLSQMGI